MATDELLIYLFAGKPHLLSQPMATWLAASRRFTTFVTAFRDKIRKKLRVTQEQESLLDLRLELETAYLLLQERSLSLVYEPLLAGRIRSPDFAVTFTTSHTFMLEVTRLRAGQAGAEEPSPTGQAPNINPDNPIIDERLADTICSKVSQLLPQQSNVLLVGTEALSLTPNDLRAMMIHIQQRAERNDKAFLERYGFGERSDFFRFYQRMSEILVRRPHEGAAGTLVAWANPQARIPLPGKVRTALHRSLAE